MAREIYIDCIRRDPSLAIEALCHDLQGLRPGASCVVVLADDLHTIEAVSAWAGERGVSHWIMGHQGHWSVRMLLLPEDFGELPPVMVAPVAA